MIEDSEFCRGRQTEGAPSSEEACDCGETASEMTVLSAQRLAQRLAERCLTSDRTKLRRAHRSEGQSVWEQRGRRVAVHGDCLRCCRPCCILCCGQRVLRGFLCPAKKSLVFHVAAVTPQCPTIAAPMNYAPSMRQCAVPSSPPDIRAS